MVDDTTGERILSFLGRPQGDPSRLHQGARVWERLSEELDESFRTLQRAVEDGVGNGAWRGRASRSFLEVWEPLQVAGRDGRLHLRTFSEELSHLAAKIEDAQNQWEQAIATAAVVTGVSVGLTFFTFGASNAVAAGAAARSAATIATIAAWLDSVLLGAGAVFSALATTAISLAARFTVNLSVNLVAQGTADAIQRPDHNPFHFDLSDAAAYASLDTIAGRLVPTFLPRGASVWVTEGATGAVSDMAVQWASDDDLDWLQVGLSGGLGAGAGGLSQKGRSPLPHGQRIAHGGECHTNQHRTDELPRATSFDGPPSCRVVDRRPLRTQAALLCGGYPPYHSGKDHDHQDRWWRGQRSLRGSGLASN